MKRYIIRAIRGYETEESDTGEWVRFEDAKTAIKAAIDAERNKPHTCIVCQHKATAHIGYSA